MSTLQKQIQALSLSQKISLLTLLFVVLLVPVSVLALISPIQLFQRATADSPITALITPEILVDTDQLKGILSIGTQGIYPTDPTPDPVYFGSYVAQPVGEDLYVGISAGLPAEKDGAVLAKYSQNTLFPVLNSDNTNPISEQGMHDISYDGQQLYILGTDPTEDWSMGNIYTYIPGQDIIKHRTLENTMHSLGSLVEGSTVYVGTGSHTGDSATWEGRLYKSTDNGETWTHSVFSNYRLWDVVRLKGDMYGSGITIDGGWQNSAFRKSTNNGITWHDVTLDPRPYYRTRLVEFNGMLVNKPYGAYDKVWKYDGVSSPTVTSLPHGYYNFHDYALNAMAVDTRGYFYMLAKKSLAPGGGTYPASYAYIVIRTNDLQNWQVVTELPSEPFSLAYWPSTDQLIVGTMGDNAKIWKIPLSDNLALPPINPIPTLTPTPVPPTPTPTWYPVSPLTPVISENGKLELSSFGNIAVANPDGTALQNFIPYSDIKPFSPRDASWSLDGKEMVFIAYRFDSSAFKSYYKIMSKTYPDGSYKEWLPEQPAGVVIGSPHFSPDKQSVFFSMSTSLNPNNNLKAIYRVSSSSPIPELIIPPHQTQGSYLLRDISSDGNKLMYYFTGNGWSNQNEDIFIANIDGSNPIDITNTPGTQELYPSFSPDGNTIIFYKHTGSSYDLFTMNVDGTNIKPLVATTDYDEGVACFSPDGARIIYSSTTKATPYQYGLFTINADGSNKKKVMDTNNNLWLNMHCWAPDPLYVSPTPTPSPSCNFTGQQTLVLHQGANGYSGVQDLSIIQTNHPDTKFCGTDTVSVAQKDRQCFITEDYYPINRALLGFDLDQLRNLQNIQIDSAVLRLSMVKWDGKNNTNLNIGRLLKPFDQSVANWQKATNNINWTVAGASRNTIPNPDYILSSGFTTTTMTMNYPITNLAQDWLAGSNSNNFNLLLYTNQQTSKYFASSEHPDTNRRPQLTIKYGCRTGPDLPTPTPTQPPQPTDIPTPTSSTACSNAKVVGNIFIDKDNDGVYDSGESFTANGIKDGSSRFVITTNPGNFTTATYPPWNGWYELSLTQGSYTLNAQLPSGYTLSKPNIFPRSFSICRFNQQINIGVIKK